MLKSELRFLLSQIRMDHPSSNVLVAKGKKQRIDVLLVERGLFPSRQKASAAILAHDVLIDDVPCTKPGTIVSSDLTGLRIRDNPNQNYVGRGALKLKAAFEAFSIETKGKFAMDVGASTGGFTQVLLEAGCEKVIAIDVGHNQMDWKLRSDPRVLVMEGVNARYLSINDLPYRPEILTIDVSFIALEKIVPALLALVNPHSHWVTLVKPQFEADPSQIGKGGIIKDETIRNGILQRVLATLEKLGLQQKGLIESPIKGTSGNVEYLVWWQVQEKSSPVS